MKDSGDNKIEYTKKNYERSNDEWILYRKIDWNNYISRMSNNKVHKIVRNKSSSGSVR